MKRYTIAFLLGVIICVPLFLQAATFLFPNRGGTGTGTVPAKGDVLVGQPDGTYAPQATSTLGLGGAGGGSGTVTSVAMSTPTGLEVSGSPITTSGTLALSLTSGYNIPLTASTSQWATAYSWGDWSGQGFITSADDTVSGTELDGVFSSTGLLRRTGAGTYSTITDSSSNWNTAFGWGNHASAGYLLSTSIDTSAELSTILTDETGTGNAVFSASPTFTGTPILPSGFLIGANSFNRTGAHNLTFTTSGTTALTLPTSGTVAVTTSAMTGTFDGNNFGGGAIGQGDILYGSAAGTISELAKDTNATRYLSNTGASNNPAWAQINLTNGVTGALDVSDNTNLTAGRSLTMSGDSVEADVELYTDTKCIWFENPTADDDFKSFFKNHSGGDYTLTKMWGESDQTVAFDFQVDDGTPADVNGTDITPTAGTAEDTTLSGDTTLANGETLDLAITSVSGTPTYLSACITYTKND